MIDIWTVFGPQKDHLYSAVLADVLDALGHRTSALPPSIRPLRPEWRLFGRAATLSAMPVASEPAEPYARELECIDLLRPGDVLVATMNGDRGSALWGELLSTAARAHEATGAVIDGLTRDATRIVQMDFPVFAAGFSPLDSKGRIDAVSHGQPIRIGDCVVRPATGSSATLTASSWCPPRWPSRRSRGRWRRSAARTGCARSWPGGGASGRCLGSMGFCERGQYVVNCKNLGS